MSDYVKTTDFAAKDALASGNAAKIVKGTEINTEFANIAVAIATKANLASPTLTGTVVLPATTSIGNVSDTELAYLDGVTSAIQTQITAKYSTSRFTCSAAAPSGGAAGDIWFQKA